MDGIRHKNQRRQGEEDEGKWQSAESWVMCQRERNDRRRGEKMVDCVLMKREKGVISWFQGKKMKSSKNIITSMLGSVIFRGQSLPLVQDRRHQSRCRCCGRGCWLCPAARWPEFCWGAGKQKGAGTQANRQKRHKMAILFLLQNQRCAALTAHLQ